jgi:anti-anti-sigma factor
MLEEARITQMPVEGGARVLRVSGRLDAKNAHALAQECHRALGEGASHVVVNLEQVSFVASSGIGSLLALTETFQDAGGSLRLAPISGAVRSVVDLLNLGRFLRIEASEEAALQSIGA